MADLLPMTPDRDDLAVTRQQAKRALAECFQVEDRLDAVVRSRIPRRVSPGTEEWEILYRRYMDEEIRKVQG